MLSIDCNNIIRITKGNSAVIDITPIDDVSGDPYILQEHDYVLFTVKNRQAQKIIQKTLTNEDYDEDDTSLNCVIDPEDTIDIRTGEYKYDCLLTTSDGQVITFISSSFIVVEAHGFYTDINNNDNSASDPVDTEPNDDSNVTSNTDDLGSDNPPEEDGDSDG